MKREPEIKQGDWAKIRQTENRKFPVKIVKSYYETISEDRESYLWNRIIIVTEVIFFGILIWKSCLVLKVPNGFSLPRL